ncbi:MAG TPA: mannose-6-phosphate isomerase, partial [Acidothermaceae bacterium]|nr:mannose-6-phosphate isomerase [Acidothermaceae bacterium]
WIASTVSKYGDDDGATRVADGELLRTAIAANPESYFGAEHVARFGASPALLVKLLDAGERLPVHCHPDRAFASTHLGSLFGKTEAWIILGTPGDDPHVYLGFNRDVEQAELAEWFENQSSEEILSSMNRVSVGTGDAIFVPAGTAHAIGAGVFIAELQEPTDFSVMLEWRDFGLPERHDEQLGISAELSLQCFNRRHMTDAGLSRCVRRSSEHRDGVTALFPDEAEPFFQAEEIFVTDTVELGRQYAVLIVLEGTGSLATAHSEMALARGATVMIPYSAGPTTLRSTGLHVIRCLPGNSTRE